MKKIFWIQIIVLAGMYVNVFAQTDSLQSYEGISKDPLSVAKGRQLFGAHCAECHAICNEIIGPALGSVHATRPLPWLVKFIRNSQEVIQEGDEYAIFIYNQYSQTVMPTMEFLSVDEIRSILAYIQYESSPASERGGVTTMPKTEFFDTDEPEYTPSDSLISRHSKDDSDKEISIPKKVVFLTLSVLTIVGMVALFVFIAKKFR